MCIYIIILLDRLLCMYYSKNETEKQTETNTIKILYVYVL